jgi:hypothetical protein
VKDTLIGLALLFTGLIIFRQRNNNNSIGNVEDELFVHSSLVNGKKYGYPACCIREFCENTPSYMKRNGASQTDRMRFEASKLNGEYTGFIPCKAHAEAILRGEIELQSLISNRDESLNDFPVDWSLK